MQVLLYVWEYGHDLGHVSVFLPIAKQLRQQGWTVIFSIPYQAGEGKAKILLENHGFEIIENPGAAVIDDQLMVDNHVQLLNALPGFRSQIDFEFFYTEWLSVLDKLNPDVVVGDFSLVALIAARSKNIKTVCLDLGFFVPASHSVDDLPSFAMHAEGAETPECSLGQRRETAHNLLQLVNAVLSKYSAKPLASFLDLYQSDLRLILNYSELTQFDGHNPAHIFGAVIPNNGGAIPHWPQPSVRHPKIFVYLKLGAPETARVAEALSTFTDTSVLMFIPQCSDTIKKAIEKPHITVSSEPFDMTKVYADANLVICHAGAGMIAQSLLHGIPMLLFPQHLEQRLNAMRVIGMGAGFLPKKGCDVKAINYLVYLALGEPKMLAKARSFALRNQPANVEAISLLIEKLVGEKSSLSTAKNHSLINIRKQPSTINMRNFDVFFWAPNSNTPRWEQLKAIVPSAQFIKTENAVDAAKQARQLSKTERFITISDVCQVSEDFFNDHIEMPDHLGNAVWRWPAVNNITGLTYPSNDLICWTKTVVDLFTNSPNPNDLLGFYRYPTHYTFSRLFSIQIANRSAEDAFISSYKATSELAALFEGNSEKLIKHHNALLARKLFMHMSLGSDTTHGEWSLLSSRLAFAHTLGLLPETTTKTDDDSIRSLFQHLHQELGDSDGQKLLDKISGLHATITAKIPKPGLLEADANKSALLKKAIQEKRETTSSWFLPFNINSTL